MSKPYRYDARLKGYRVEGCARSLKNKAQAGLVATQRRSNHHVKDDLLALSVHGTFDVLARAKWHKEAVPQVVRYRLSENGKAKLVSMREAR